MLRTIDRDIASAIIISADQKVLLGRKDPTTGAVYADGSWLIPGGGIEPGESSLQAMRREVIEETSLDVTQYPTVLVEDKATSQAQKTLDTGEKVNIKMKFITYRVDINESAAAIPTHPSDELPTLEWVNISNLETHKLPSPSMELFIKLGLIK